MTIRALDTDADGRVVLRGQVVENSRACELDAACVLTVDVNGLQINVVYHFGEWPPCENEGAIRQGLEVHKGEWIEVYAEVSEGGDLVTCGSSDYYIRPSSNE